ncbi:MAG: hypothetical protein KDE27_05335 [Planctomycetes bacterium]|nr:hypothetical protein [Planctomycetota bacterium]
MNKNRSASPVDAASSDLHRVRDILFGELERDTSARIAALEKRLEEQSATIAELTSSLRRQATDQEQRLGRAIADATAGGDAGRDALRAELMRAIDELGERKLDRDALAGLLGGIAEQLGKPSREAR